MARAVCYCRRVRGKLRASMPKAETFSRWVRPVFYLSVAAAFALIFFETRLSLFFVSVIYLGYILLSLFQEKTDFLVIEKLFFVVLLLTAGFVAYHMASGGVGVFDSRSEKRLAYPLLALMIPSAVHALITRFDIPLEKLAQIALLAMLAGLAAKLLLLTSQGELANVWTGSNRLSALTGQRANDQDDIFVFVAAASIFLAGYLSFEGGKGRVAALGLLILVVFFAELVILGRSRAAWLALSLALSGSIVMLFLTRRFWTALSILLIAGVLVLINWQLVGERMMKEADTHRQILQDLSEDRPASSALQPETGTGNIVDAESEAERERLIREVRTLTTSAFARLQLLEAAWFLWREKPIMGFGGLPRWEIAAAYDVPHENLFLSYTHFHNLYADIAVRGGLYLLTVYAILIAALAVFLFRLGRLYWRGELGPTVFFPLFVFATYLLFENLFDLSLIDDDHQITVQCLFMVMIGMAMGHTRRLG